MPFWLQNSKTTISEKISSKLSIIIAVYVFFLYILFCCIANNVQNVGGVFCTFFFFFYCQRAKNDLKTTESVNNNYDCSHEYVENEVFEKKKKINIFMCITIAYIQPLYKINELF